MRVFWIFIALLTVFAAITLWRSESTSADRAGSVSGSVSAASPTTPAATVAAPSGRPSPAVPAAAPVPANADEFDDDPESLAAELAMSAADRAYEDSEQSLSDALNAGMPDGAFGGEEDDFNIETDEIVDGRYIVSGDGTAESPYEITWDLLILAAQTYQPRQGRTDIPARIAAIDGKQIKIAGYFTFPIASTDPKELLFMLNMWDGCCIGMPPSPYDAIEVRLATSIDSQQFLNYGTLTGTLTVDPYVQNGWLLGMYVMADGKLDVGM